MLLKGLSETQAAGNPIAAAEMALIRLAYAAELPSPAELIKSLAGERPGAPAASAKAAPPPRGEGGARNAAAPTAKPSARGASVELPTGGPQAALAREPEVAEATAPEAAGPESFAALVELVEANEPLLGAQLRNNVHLVRFEPGRLEFRPEAEAPANLAPRLTTLLARWTGRRWAISVAREGGAPTLSEEAKRARADRLAEAASLPLVEAVLKSFPGAVVESVRPLVDAAETGAAEEPEAAAEVELGEGDAEPGEDGELLS